MTPRLCSELLDAGRDEDQAVVTSSAVVTYGALRSTVERLAAHLRGQGLEPGDRAVVVLQNGAPFVAALFAIWRVGGVPVPLDARSPALQIAEVARDCGARGLVCHGRVFAEMAWGLDTAPTLRFAVVEALQAPRRTVDLPLSAFESALEEAGPVPPAPTGDREDLALIAYTSGTSGRPKGVMLSHQSLIHSLTFTARHLGLDRSNRVLVPIPMHHLFALRVLLTHLWIGATVVAELDLFAGLRGVRRTNPDSLTLVPAACKILVERFAPMLKQIAQRIRRISVGSASISPDVLGVLRQLLPDARIDIPYGMTEARIGFVEPVPGRLHRRLFAVDPNLEVLVLDDDWNPIEEGLGEIVLRGPSLMLGYWHNSPDENRRLREQGLRTRDLMEVTAEGDRYLVGRVDDVISVGGEKVFPQEVEAALDSHPAVRESRAFGVADPRGVRGQVVKAAVVLEAGHRFDENSLLQHCRTRLEPYKVPTFLESVAEIRRNAMGKIVEMPPQVDPQSG